jgi:putative ABC transport system permease protein
MNLTNLLRHVSLKHVKLQKTQLIVAMASVCLGVAAMSSIGIVNKSVFHLLEESMNQVTGRASLQVTAAESGFPEEMLERVRKVPGVEYAAPVIEANASLSGGKERALMILGVDALQDNEVRNYSIKTEYAEIPDPLLFLTKPDSILITRALADRESIKINREIRILTVRGVKTLKVRGLLNPEGPAKAAGGDIAVMDIHAAQMAFGKEGLIDRIDVGFLPGETVATMKERIQRVLPQGYDVDTPTGRTRQVEALLDTFKKVMGFISVMALVVGMYLIYNAVSISTVQRRKEIGILRALGARRGEIVRLFLGEALLFSAVGSALGIVLGLVFAKLTIGMVARTVTESYLKASVSGITFSWVDLLGSALLGIVAGVLSAVAPALSISRISPISAIRSLPYSGDSFLFGRKIRIVSAAFLLLSFLILAANEMTDPASPIRRSGVVFLSPFFLGIGISLFTPTFLKWFVALTRPLLSTSFGAVGRLAGMNLQKNLARNGVAVAAIFLSFCLFVGTRNDFHSVRRSFFDYFDSSNRADILISSGHPLASGGVPTIPMPPTMREEIEKTPGVRSVDPVRRTYVGYNGRRVMLESFDVAVRMGYSPLMIADGHREAVLRLLPRHDNLVVNEGFAARYRVKQGDSVTLPTPSGPVRFGVAAVMVNYSSDSGVIGMDASTYQQHWKDSLVDIYSVRVESQGSLLKTRDAILERFGKERRLFALSAGEYRAEVRKALDDGFAMTNAVSGLTLIIAGFGVVIALLASVLERAREIGTLRSVGMKRSQVSAVILIESALIGVAGGLMAMVGGVLNGWIVLEGFIRIAMGASTKYYLSYPALFSVLFLSAGLSMLAGLYPAWRAAKTNIVKALAYE